MSQILSPALISELNKIASQAPGTGFGDVLEILLQGLEPAEGFVHANPDIVACSAFSLVKYDIKGLCTASKAATCDDIADGVNTHLVSTAQKTIINNTTGTNAGDETKDSIKSKLGLAAAFTPASPTAAGTIGDMAYDATFFYICTATGTVGNANWVRFAIDATWGI